jgi:hypothetical protein
MEEIIEEASLPEAPVVDAPAELGTAYGDMYLKFPDEATAFEALYRPVVREVVTYDDEGTPTYTEEVVEGEFTPRYDMSIDTIGIIYRVDNTDPPADSVGLENPVSTPEEGWHVNTRGEMPWEFQAFAVVPTNPRRVWA